MKISVIIVNYNVEFFLEQCLNAAVAALQNVEGEIIVVDNHSIDGSVAMVKDKFPNIQLIENKENVGFSKANNQALRIAEGEYHLLLNPDTIVEEDTFEKVVAFMDQHPDAGGLGVKMIDGKGNFLPESKRGLPTPGVAFSKIFGLSRLFPKSKRFGRYHLSYLDKDKIHEVDILSGAFMLMRKSVLDKVGLLDEDFFMYGEDIDLSYRIIQGGYKNYYYPETRIIHYKGESTKKSSVNYVFVFYNAMIIFAKKHFSDKNARLYSFLINLAIYFRASLAIGNRFVKKVFLPLLDYSILLAGLFGIAHLYQLYEDKVIPKELLVWGLPIYALVWFLTEIYAGAYDKPIRLIRSVTGGIIGTAIILMVYALLPKDLQFSRLIILLGGGWVTGYYLVTRVFFHFTLPSFRIGGAKNKKFAIVGGYGESRRVADLLKQTNIAIEEVQFVSAGESENRTDVIGDVSQLSQVVDIHKVDEVIFCAKDVSSEKIISQMLTLEGRNLDFKIAQPETSFLIGSNSIETQGDLYVLDINRINKPRNRRNKRTADVLLSFLMLLIFPVMIWMYKNKGRWLGNMLRILFGRLSFVGYAEGEKHMLSKLPNIKRGVLTALLLVPGEKKDQETISRLNLIYAKNHSLLTDLKLIFRNIKLLDA